VLVDTAPYDPELLAAHVRQIPAVKAVLRARSRGSEAEAHVDIDVQVAPEMTTEQTAALGEAIRSHLQEQLSGIREVEVHFEPVAPPEPDYAQSAHARALPLDLTTHEVHVSDGPDGKIMELHVEVPSDETLAAAHERVSLLEQAVKATLPDVVEVVTHIEPSLKPGAANGDDSPQTGYLEARIRSLLDKRYPTVNWHQLYVHPLADGYAISMHLTLPPEMRVEAAHRVAEQIETQLRLNMPEVERVTIHTEPPD
jgi:divalent metal cation (Fe/Co/Zn/Cd) transporter